MTIDVFGRKMCSACQSLTKHSKELRTKYRDKGISFRFFGLDTPDCDYNAESKESRLAWARARKAQIELVTSGIDVGSNYQLPLIVAKTSDPLRELTWDCCHVLKTPLDENGEVIIPDIERMINQLITEEAQHGIR
jgi:hypothetical protein